MNFKAILSMLLRVIKSSLFITVLGLLALALLIWFGGPLVAIAGVEPLATTSARLITLLSIALIWMISQFIKRSRELKNHNQAVESLLSSDEQQHDELAKRDIEILTSRMQKAIDILKNARFSRARDIYQLPWYMLIGAPGSGKTTTLQNSGLEFPLMEQLGIDPISGVGGTRQCDWWFTNEAVLIDTAGRYTTQDSHASQDSAAWQGFLGLLRKYRPRRPINGVLVFVSLSDLINQTKTERNIHARAIKQRVQELQSQLGMTFPVYVIFTKADLVAGFTEFFADLSAEEREQVWGVTFSADQTWDETGAVSQFNKEFHALINRLYQRLFTCLQHERDLESRSAIYEFPRQLRLLQSAADDFLKEIFSQNPFEKSTMLRGVYITSATQQGIPIDRIMQQVGGSSGLAEPPLRQQKGEGKGYFIHRFFENILIPERDLATVNLRHKTKNTWLRRGVTALTLIATTWILYAWYDSYRWNQQLIENAAQSIEHYKAASKSNTDLLALNNQLSILRDMPAGYAGVLPDGELKSIGLYQGDKLGQSAKIIYSKALYSSLLPELVNGLTSEMRTNSTHRDYLYETLKTYLMLYHPEKFKSEQITAWYDAYLQRHLPGELNSDTRSSLLSHLNALIVNGVQLQNYNDKIVAETRDILLTMPLSDLAYQKVKNELMKNNIPDFKLSDVLGMESANVIVRKSGASLKQGIPGLYTYQGFHGVFNIEKRRILKALLADNWIYGDIKTEENEEVEKVLSAQVTEKYLRDYTNYWKELLADLDIQKIDDLEQGLYVTKVLAGPEQPIQSLIKAFQQNTKLSSLPESANVDMTLDVAGKVADTKFSSQKSRIGRLLPDELPDFGKQLPGHEVELAFAPLLAINSAQMEQIAQTSQQYYAYLERLYAPSGGMAMQAFANQRENNAGELSVMLRRLRSDVPSPFSDWLGNISTDTSKLFAKGSRQHINDAWKSNVVSEYQKAIHGRYPLDRNSSVDIKIRDFERFFGYGGVLEQFFIDYLSPFVNTNLEQWRFKQNIGVSDRVLKTFQTAQNIRTMYFEPGSQKLKIGFRLKPIYLDKHITHLLVELDGQELSYRHGPTRMTQFFWPGDRSRLQTRLVFTPANSGLLSSNTFKGEWSWFRLLDELVKERPETKDDGILYLSVQGNKARVELVPDSVDNPFLSGALEAFKCPNNL